MEEKKGISGSALKMVAIVTMLIDHIGATVVMRMLSARGFIETAQLQDQGAMMDWFALEGNLAMYITYTVLRQIGRIAFPIYCFMLVEGVQKTSNVWKYAMRLGVFALISEIPFDLAFNGKVLEFRYQNVFFTLLLGLLSLAALQKIGERTWNANARTDKVLKVILSMAASAVGMGAAALLQTDYAWRGVACIILMYLFRRVKWQELVAGYCAFGLLLGEIAAAPAFLLLAFYRGRRGFRLKYFFYGFYPVHLLLLYLACVLLGIAGYRAL